MALSDCGFVLRGFTESERDIVLMGGGKGSLSRYIVIRGGQAKDVGRDAVVQGKPLAECEFVLGTKDMIERSFVLEAGYPVEGMVVYRFGPHEITDLALSAARIVNKITINYGFDFAEGKYKSSITKQNPLSMRIYGELPATLNLEMIQMTRQADKLADAYMKLFSVPQIILSFTHSQRSFFVEAGEIVSVTHPAGIGEAGFADALGVVMKKNHAGARISYQVLMKSPRRLYQSELVGLTQAAGAGESGISISYENGIATLTIYADVAGYPPVEGAEVTIGGKKRITDARGQVRFALESPGTYTAVINASGYADAEITFSIGG